MLSFVANAQVRSQTHQFLNDQAMIRHDPFRKDDSAVMVMGYTGAGKG